MSVIDELREYGLTEEAYEALLDECADKTHKQSPYSWDDIVHRFNLDWTGDCVRKATQVPLVGGTFVKEYFEAKSSRDLAGSDLDSIQRLNAKIQDLEKEKVAYRDQRNAWTKHLRETSRIETNLNLLEQELRSIGKSRYDLPIDKYIRRKDIDSKEIIVCLSDLHVGLTFENSFGQFNTEILKDRLAKYAERIIQAAQINEIEYIKVVGLGDLINGNIHRTVAINNRENVIEQIKTASVLIADFCYSLLSQGLLVDFYNVSGNHSRISKKEDALHDERLDDLIGWIVSQMLLPFGDLFKYHQAIDTGIAVVESAGHKFVAVHGDFDYSTPASMYKLSTMLGMIPFGLLCGHKHSNSFSDLNGVKVIQSGSIAGTGDEYTIEKRLSGTPSQMAFIVDQNGIEQILNIEFGEN